MPSPRSLAPLELKSTSPDHVLLLPSFFSLCSETLDRAAHGRALTETPPLAADDTGLPEQIGLGQKNRRDFFILLAPAIGPGSSGSSRFLHRLRL